MTSTAYTFLAGLPAVLGFGAFIFYLFIRHRGPANQISIQLIALVKERSGGLPDLDSRLTGKQVFGLLKEDKGLRDAFTPAEVSILEGARASERRQQWFAFIFLGGTVVLSLLLYLVLVWKPWVKPNPHPINHFAADFSFSRAVPPEMNGVWQELRRQCQAAFDTGDREKQLNAGFAFTPILLETKPELGLAGYRVMIIPGFPAWNNLQKITESESPDIGATEFVMFNASFVFTDSALPADMSKFDAKTINRKWDFMVVSALVTMSIPLSFELDFAQNRYRIFSSSYVPMVAGQERWIATWEDFAGLNLVVMVGPPFGGGWNLDFLRFHSELGLQYSITGKDIVPHVTDSGPGLISNTFTAVVPPFRQSGLQQ